MIPPQPLSRRPLFRSENQFLLWENFQVQGKNENHSRGAPVVNIIHKDPMQTAQQDNVSNSHSNTDDTGGLMLTCPTEHILTPMPSTSTHCLHDALEVKDVLYI